MKHILTFIFILICCVNTGYLRAQTDQDAAMKAWTAYMTPGDVHKMIARSDGTWNTEVSIWMAPDAKPITGKGSCTNQMILGGRYQESKYTGDFMGMPMQGIGTLGYDNATKRFQSTWIDNLGTGIMQMAGTWDGVTKTINFEGTQVDPMSGKDMKVREAFQIVTDNSQLMQMFITPEDGSEFKSMEIKFTRK